MSVQTQAQLTEARAEYRRVLGISLPLLGYYLSEVAIGLTDLYIVGQLGSVELAAVGLGKTLVFGWLMLGFCVLSLVSVLSAEALAQGKPDRLTGWVVQGLWLATALALLGMLVVSSAPWIMVQLGYAVATQAAVEEYLRWVIWMLVPGLWFAVGRNFLTVMGRTQVFLLVSVAAVLANVLLNQVLVFGRLGFPALGVAGAGIATVVVNVLSLLILMAYAGWAERQRCVAVIRQLGRVEWNRLWTLLRLGLPAGGMQLFESGFFIVISLLIGVYGAAWLAANNVVLAVMDVTFVIMLSLGEGLSVRMAFQQGAHRPDLVRALARFGLWLGSGLMLMVSLLLWLRPEWVVSLFMNANVPGYQETLDKAVVLAGIAAVFLLFDGYQVLATWMLRGLKDTLFPMLLGLSGYWVVGLGLGAGFSFVLGYGAPGLWWGFALGLITAGALLLLRLYNRLRAASAGPR